MTTDQPPEPPAGNPSRRPLLIAFGLALLVAVAAGAFLATRSHDRNAAATPTAPSSAPTTVAPTTTLDPKVEVVARLREILRVRERALSSRRADLLDQIYTDDCPCLPAGRKAIAALINNHIVWRGRSVTLSIEAANPISDRVWEVDATFVSKPFRIETEAGALIRIAPEERQRWRFVLARQPQRNWLLGRATVLQNG